MTRKERIDHLETVVRGIVSSYQRLSSSCQAAIDAGAMDINGPLHESIWRAFSGMLDLSDSDGWIAWFIYDNECGKKARKSSASQKTKAKPIRTCRQLAALIAESETP